MSEVFKTLSGADIDVRMMCFIALILTCLLLVTIFITQRILAFRSLPPGPWGFPIFGCLPRLGRKPHVTVQSWWDKYGDIVSLRLGSHFCVILNGVDMMHECLVQQQHVFAGRPWNNFRKLTNNKGIVFTEGEVWREHRRFTMSCLRDFGMGRVSLEMKLHEEARFLIERFMLEDGRPVDPQLHLPKAISNIVCSIIYGSRFDYDNEVFQANIEELYESVRLQSLLSTIQFLPWLAPLQYILLPINRRLMRNVRRRQQYARAQLTSHRTSLDPAFIRDFIDAYLCHMGQLKTDNKPTTFDESQLERTIQDLFIAGSETVNSTLKWALLFMAVHGQTQSRVQAEIDAVLGSGRQASMRDRVNMPVTEATLMECQRLGNIALFSVPRCTTENTTVGGHHVPKGTWVFVNRWGVHASTKYWKRPKAFDPDRFLDEQGKVLRHPAFIPFGIGPRSCLGEGLARMELFIFFTSILQVFRVETAGCVPTLEPQAGINLSPHPYTIRFVLR